jgi:hypothetical protein
MNYIDTGENPNFFDVWLIIALTNAGKENLAPDKSKYKLKRSEFFFGADICFLTPQ